MKRTLLAAAAILLLLNLITIPAGHSAIRTVTGTVIKVSDGDSIQIMEMNSGRHFEIKSWANK